MTLSPDPKKELKLDYRKPGDTAEPKPKTFPFNVKKLRRMIEKRDLLSAQSKEISDNRRKVRTNTGYLSGQIHQQAHQNGVVQDANPHDVETMEALQRELTRLDELYEEFRRDHMEFIGLVNRCEQWARETHGWRDDLLAPRGGPTIRDQGTHSPVTPAAGTSPSSNM